MTFDDFPTDPQATHPEVVYDPESIKPAQQETLRKLLDEITKRTLLSKEIIPGWKPADLYAADDDSRGAAIVSTWRKGVSLDNPDYVGQVVRRGWTYGDNNEGTSTSYGISDTPDGLQVEKHISVDPHLDLVQSVGQLAASVNSLREETDARLVARQIENELGLTFVSDKEVLDLIEFLQPLQPSST